MVQSYKHDVVYELKTRLKDAKAIILVDYKGINIEEVNALRNRLRNAGVDYFVQKNTLIQIALHELGIESLDSYLVGPTAVAVCLRDEVAPAREIAKFVKEVMADKGFPSFKAGYVGGNVLDANQVMALAKLPSREELLARILGSMSSPLSGFVGVLQGMVRQVIYAVDAVAKQKAEQ
jgi:large subunit ribosomal protein L10